MKLGEGILQILNKTYEPSTMISMRFHRYDLGFKTDEHGRPVLLFMGHKDEKGNIKGERYARVLKQNRDGEQIKNHWEHKGKAT